MAGWQPWDPNGGSWKGTATHRLAAPPAAEQQNSSPLTLAAARPAHAPGLLAASGDKGARRHISHHIPLILLLLLYGRLL